MFFVVVVVFVILQQKETVKKLTEWKTKNDGLTRQKCQELLKNVKEKYLNPILRSLRGPTRTNITSKEIDNAYSKIEKDYKRLASGAEDVRADVFQVFYEVCRFPLREMQRCTDHKVRKSY